MPSEPVEAFPPMPTFIPEGSTAYDDGGLDTKTDIKVSHIPLPPLPNVSASAPPTSTLPTIPGGHSDEDQSSDASSTHSKPEKQDSSNSSSTSEPATVAEKREVEQEEDVASKTRARAGSSSASMKKNQSHDNVRRLSVAGMQQLTAPRLSLWQSFPTKPLATKNNERACPSQTSCKLFGSQYSVNRPPCDPTGP
ncbi:hypothetical protein ColLi_02779 [Colletotrichum liriopes]|uniref:Uncharacterized protein n=1 Tax=Colletotrichum liriopes TaxID=708192 RepID=A0AA37GGE2_9PEZI|nr:hypothetical protein ColLi_02779 [Colletotrichum liriopes]